MPDPSSSSAESSLKDSLTTFMNATPVMRVGRGMVSGGDSLMRAYDAVKEKVASAVQPAPKKRTTDIRLPNEAKRRASMGKR
jgi:hypothetical protein